MSEQWRPDRPQDSHPQDPQQSSQGQPGYGGEPPYGRGYAPEPSDRGQYASYPGQQYPGGGYGGYPEPSQGVLALVLGLVGLFVFQPLAPFAWVIGNREIQAVDAGRREPSNQGLAVAGKVLGIIGTVILVLGALILAIALVAYLSW